MSDDDLFDSMLRQMCFRLALFGGYGTPATLSWDVESDATGLVLS